MIKMGINSKAKNQYLIVLVILIIVSFLPIIDLDRNIHFSCITINKDKKLVLKCFAEPSEARFVTNGSDIKLNSGVDFLPKKKYEARVYIVDNEISYYNGIAYRPVFGEFKNGSFRTENIMLDGTVKVQKMSVLKLVQVKVLNWLEPYSGEKITFQ